MANGLGNFFGGGGSYEPRIEELEEAVENIKPSYSYEVIDADTTGLPDSAYLCDLRATSTISVKLPLNPALGTAITIGDYNGDCSILKPIQIYSDDKPIEGVTPIGDILYITQANVKLTFSFVDEIQGWKIVDGIGEGGAGQEPYEEVVILPYGEYNTSTNYELPTVNGVQYKWTDFERVELIAGRASSTLTQSSASVTKESILAAPTGFGIILQDNNAEYAQISADGESSFDILCASTRRVKSLKGYTKYKPVVSTASVIETGRTATAWYRKWSDGFIEQGGIVNGPVSSGTVTLPIAFSDNTFSLQLSFNVNNGTYNTVSIRETEREDSTGASFQWAAYNVAAGGSSVHNMSWTASGY